MNHILMSRPVARAFRSRTTLLSCLAVLFATSTGVAQAAICDHRPTKIASKAVAAASGTVVATGVGMKALGFYTLSHATSGSLMLGSTLAGSSAAGTVGIIGGTGAGVGAAAAAVMSPAALTAGAIVLIGSAAFEGTCYLVQKRSKP